MPGSAPQHGAARFATLRPNWPATGGQHRTKSAEPRKQGQPAAAHNAPALRNAAHGTERCPGRPASRIKRADHPAGRPEALQKAQSSRHSRGILPGSALPARGRPPGNAPAKLARHGQTAQNQKGRAPEAGPASHRPRRPSPQERSPRDGKVPQPAGEPHSTWRPPGRTPRGTAESTPSRGHSGRYCPAELPSTGPAAAQSSGQLARHGQPPPNRQGKAPEPRAVGLSPQRPAAQPTRKRRQQPAGSHRKATTARHQRHLPPLRDAPPRATPPAWPAAGTPSPWCAWASPAGAPALTVKVDQPLRLGVALARGSPKPLSRIASPPRTVSLRPGHSPGGGPAPHVEPRPGCRASPPRQRETIGQMRPATPNIVTPQQDQKNT